MLLYVKQTITSFAEEVPATHAHLSDVRRAIGAWLRAQGVVSQTAVGDVEMVVSELGANVVDHTGSRTIRIALELSGDRVVIDVVNRGSAYLVPAIEEWGELVEGSRGRGLRIIRALCAEIVVSGDTEHTHIRCDVVCADAALD